MNYSRRQLYALGEAFGESATCAKAGGGRLYGGGGGGDSTTSTEGARTTTTNTDQRMAIQDGIGVNGSGNSASYTSNVNSPDAVIAIANAGADVIKSSGGAVVDLFKDAGARNEKMWGTAVTESSKLIDKLLEKTSEGFALSTKVVDSFQPNENKNTDAIKTAAIAAAVLGVAMIFARKQ